MKIPVTPGTRRLRRFNLSVFQRPTRRERRVPMTTRSEKGSVLVIAIIFCALIGLILVAYLSMVKSQHKFTHRAQTWNTCIPLCEAGVEEAMAHINHINTFSNFAINGWVLHGGFYRKERSLNGGIIRMMIDQGVPPVLTVTGYLRAPVQSNLLVRAVRVKTKINLRFPYAMLSKGAVTLSSAGSYVDSFNSSDPAYSTGGEYDPTKRTAEAIIATTAKSAGVVDLGNNDVYGKIGTGPGGSPNLANGTVGDLAWVTNPANDGEIQPGHVTDDVNLYIPDVLMPNPFAFGTAPPSGIIGATTYTYILGDGDWTLPTINGNSVNIIVTGKARLYVAGSTTIGNSGSITVAPTGSLEFFANGSIDIKGTVNNPGVAKSLSFLGMNNCLSVLISAGAEFACSVYAPRADVVITGSADGSGAIVGKSIKLTGGMKWHYDKALEGDPREGRYVASSWTEL